MYPNCYAEWNLKKFPKYFNIYNKNTMYLNFVFYVRHVFLRGALFVPVSWRRNLSSSQGHEATVVSLWVN